MFDRPVWRDWLFWLTLLGVAIGLGRVGIEGTVLTILIDAAIEVGISLIVFCYVPWLIRDTVRENRDRRDG